MVPVAVLMDRVGELATALSYRHLTVTEVPWVRAASRQDGGAGRDDASGQPTDAPGTALVCDAADGRDPAADAEALTILLFDELDADALSRLGDNVVAVETPYDKLAFAQELQSCALALMDWERRLDQVALAEGTLQEFLDESEDALGNFITISDSSFRLIAHTRGIPLDDPTVMAFVERGYHDDEAIARFRRTRAMERWKRQRRSQYHEPDEGKRYPFVNHVFRVNSSYYMQMVMTCHNRPFTPGLLARFDVLARHLQRHIRRFDDARERSFEKPSAFLLDVLLARPMDEALLSQQAARLGVPLDAPVRLYELSSASDAEAAVHWTARRIAGLLPDCFVIPHEGCAYVVSVRRAEDPWRDDARIEAALAPLAAAEGGALAASGIVSGVRRLPLALAEARAARALAPARPWRSGRPALHHFELAFLPWALGPQRPPADAVQEAARQSILGHLSAADAARGGDDAALLLAYYDHHCGVTETARALGLHRNTVANRVRGLQERFDADLGEPALEVSLRGCAAVLGTRP